ncbi:unnamed protein product [Lactuca saligna]|uniref:PB1-like domain-containing protein n=1 Tax=Lactuca saligna TaxID=75948 RepID=A0AA36DYS5_LACSI|nr:unnamed protein product [Lactuca saligna]
MVLSIWCFQEKFVTVEDLGKRYEGYDNYFTLKIHYSGVFTKAPGRKYVDGVVAYVDDVDTDLFSVHELDDMEPSCQADDGANTTTVDDYEPFIEDYSLYADYDTEFNVETSFEKQPEVDYLEGMSDDSGEAFYSESGHASKDSGDDSDDNECNVDESNIQFDVDVDMSEFHNVVNVDEHGILNNHSKDEGIDMVDVEVIVADDYQFARFHEDDRKRLLKELSKLSTCSHGEVHVKPFQIGHVFKTKLDVKNYMNSHAVATRRSLYLAKNDKIQIRVKCKGVVMTAHSLYFHQNIRHRLGGLRRREGGVLMSQTAKLED